MPFMKMAIRLSARVCSLKARKARSTSRPAACTSERSMNASVFCTTGISVASRIPYRKAARRLAVFSSSSRAEARCAHSQWMRKIGTPTRINATVEVTLVYNPTDPFSTGYRDTQRAILVKQNGAWKISSMPQYNFFDYNWYQEMPK